MTMRIACRACLAALGAGCILAWAAASQAGSGTPTFTAAAQMGVFATAQTTSDVPPEVRAAMDVLPGTPERGAPVADKLRRLLNGAGKSRADVYAFPTTAGSICVIVTDLTLGATCIDRFSGKMPAAVMVYRGSGVPATLAGAVPNSVRKVEVVIDGERHGVPISHGALFFQADADTAPHGFEELIVTHASGSTVTKPLPAFPPR